MLTPEYIQYLPDGLEALFLDLEDDIIADISRRISKGLELTETADYQINILYELGYSLDDVKKEIADTIDKTVLEVEKILSEATLESYQNDEEFYKVGGKKLPPLEDSTQLNMFVQSVVRQTQNTLANFTNTMGFVDGGQFKTLDKMYRDTLDFATLQLSSGAYSQDVVAKQAVKKLADSGVRIIEYDSGVRNHMDVAVRRALRTGVSQITNKMSEVNIELAGAEYVEVTAHMGARPDHADWQGKIYSLRGDPWYPDFVETTGYGTGAGLGGWNCRHSYYPYFPGISRKAYTAAQLRDLDPEPFEYDDRTYTAYGATQKQRQIEREMRKIKRDLIAYDAAGLKDDFTASSIKLRRKRELYKDFSNKAGLKVRPDRQGIYRYGKSTSMKSVWADRKAAN